MLEQKSAELIAERSHAILDGRPLAVLRQIRILPVATSLDAVLHRVRVFGAEGVQQRLAGVVARGNVEGALPLDEAHQTSAVIGEARRVHRAVDTIEALQEGRT